MWHIINALLLRELKTRFGKNPTLGYIWVIVEPMLHILIMLLVFTLIRNRVLPQLPFSLFLICGMVPFFMFRNIVTNLINGIDANKNLFTYKPVRPFHVFIARTLLEGTIYFIIFIFLMIATGFILGYNIIPYKITNVLLIFIWLLLFSFSFGVFLSVAFYGNEMIKNLLSYFLMIFYFGSAVMFPLWIVPNNLIDYLAFNPVLHILELLKENYFASYPVVEQINYKYPLICTFVLLFFGLGIYYKDRVKLASS